MSVPENGPGEPRKFRAMKREHKPAPIAKYFGVSPLPSPSTYEDGRPRQFFENASADALPYATSSGATSSCSSPSYIFQDTTTSSPEGLFSSPAFALPPVSSVKPGSYYERRSIPVPTSNAQSKTSSNQDQSPTKFPQRDNLHRIMEEPPHESPSNVHVGTFLEENLAETTEHASLSPMVQSNPSPKTLRRVRSNLTEIESVKRRRGLVASMDIPNRIIVRRNSWHQGSPAVASRMTACRSEVGEYIGRAWTGTEDRHITDEVCDIILRQSGVSLSELSSPLDAWNCVQQCLQELTEFVDTQTPQPVAGTSQAVKNHAPISNLAYPQSQPGKVGHSFNLSNDSGSGGKRESAPDTDKRGDAGNQHPRDGNQEEDRDQHENPRRQSKGDMDYQGVKYSCPFRKRNKARFNIHDWGVCAKTPFATFSSLKKHIREYHGPGHQHKCPRCHDGFTTLEEMMVHLSRPRAEMCDATDIPFPGKLDPENGISAELDTALAARKSPDKISTWDALWRALFSDDVDIPQPDFEPPKVLEIHEIESWFHSRKPALEQGIRDAVDQVLPGINWQTHPLNNLVARITTKTVKKCLECLESDAFDVRGRARSTTIRPSSPSISTSLTQLETEAPQHTIFADQEHLLDVGPSRRKGGQQGLAGFTYSHSLDAGLQARPKDRVPAPETQSPSRSDNIWTAHHQNGYDIPVSTSTQGFDGYSATNMNIYHSPSSATSHRGVPVAPDSYSVSEQSGSMEIDSLDLRYGRHQQQGTSQPSIVLHQKNLGHDEYHAGRHNGPLQPSRDSGIEVPRPKTASGRLLTDYELGSRGFSHY